ncbi:MAG: PHP domain-containing protein [Oscillospiraceae bacterium]|nr:PHP domain-containing protein [Oscillospiraceae bacterium]
MVRLSYDLHIHSCLSPCGDDEMLPSNIAGMAFVKGLDVIALTDHNSCKNCPAAEKGAQRHGISFIPGMELCTSEEVHVLCLFPALEKAMEFDRYVEKEILPIKNNEKIFGNQLIVDEDDNEKGREPFLLINASNISFDEVYPIVSGFGGIMIPAHIDKNSNSLLSNLGFIPPDSKFKCAEVSNFENLNKLLERHEYLRNCKIISNSDAHFLGDINEPVNFIEARSKKPEDILDALLN